MAPSGCKAVFAVFNFAWKLIVASVAIHHLRQIRLDFRDILETIPEPQIRVINHPDYTGPVHIICAPPVLANYTNETCADVFNDYPAVTGNQKYFSWLYLDPGDPITNTTIEDMKGGRRSLYVLLAISTFLDIFATFSGNILRIGAEKEETCPALLKLVSSGVSKANTTTTHMLLCNFFSVSNYSHGLYLLQYVPAYGYWACYITLMVGCVCCCCAFCCAFANQGAQKPQDVEHEGCVLVLEILLIIFMVIVVALWGCSSWGFVVYVWNFSTTFKAIDASQVISILKPEYLSTLDVLNRLAKLFGVGGIFEILEDVIHFCTTRV